MAKSVPLMRPRARTPINGFESVGAVVLKRMPLVAVPRVALEVKLMAEPALAVSALKFMTVLPPLVWVTLIEDWPLPKVRAEPGAVLSVLPPLLPMKL